MAANKAILTELIEALKRETDKTYDDSSFVKTQNEELELKLKMQFSEVVVMHKHFIELRQEYLRIKEGFEKQIFELRKEIERLGGEKAMPVKIEDTLSHAAPATFNELYNSKEKEDMVRTITRRGRVASEIIVSKGFVSTKQQEGHFGVYFRAQEEEDEKKISMENLDAIKKRTGHQQGFSEKRVKEEEETKGDCDWITINNTKSDKKVCAELLQTLEHKEIVCAVRFSLCGKYLATGTNQLAKVFEVETGRLFSVLSAGEVNSGVEIYIRSLCFSTNSLFLFTGCEDKKIKMWSIKDQKLVYTFSGHEKDVYAIQCSKNGRYLYSGSGDQTIIKWEIKNGKQYSVFSIENDKKDNGITSLSLSSNDVFIAAGCLDNKIRIWHTTTKELFCVLEGHTESIYSLRFCNVDNRLVSSSLDRTAKMWLFNEKKPEETKCVKTYNDHRDYVLSAVMSSDGKWVITGSKDKTINVSDSEAGMIQFVLQGHRNSVISVDASQADPAIFASGSGDTRARIWKINPSE